jgi:hypothetical protein
MGKYGAELMRRDKQWRQAVGDGWNGVEDFRKFQEETNGGFWVAWKRVEHSQEEGGHEEAEVRDLGRTE